MWWTEVTIGQLIPMAIFFSPARKKQGGLILGAIYTIIGLALNRSSIVWFGLQGPAGYSYSPHWIEILITLAAVSAAILLYSLGVRYVGTLRPHTAEADS